MPHVRVRDGVRMIGSTRPGGAVRCRKPSSTCTVCPWRLGRPVKALDVHRKLAGGDDVGHGSLPRRTSQTAPHMTMSTTHINPDFQDGPGTKLLRLSPVFSSSSMAR
jgi:hypothetical protein